MSLGLAVLGLVVGLGHSFYESGKTHTCEVCNEKGILTGGDVCFSCNGTGRWWLPW